MRKLLIAAPAFVLGCIVTASMTTVAGAKDPAQAKSYDYVVATDPAGLAKYGKDGYAIVAVTSSGTGFSYWTLQKK